MIVAKMYNQITGANITHWDVEKWGYLEYHKILGAIEIWDL